MNKNEQARVVSRLFDTSRLLDEACDIIMGLEDLATPEQKERIEAMFNEIKYADRIDDEMRADLEAQDYDTFGESKI